MIEVKNQYQQQYESRSYGNDDGDDEEDDETGGMCTYTLKYKTGELRKVVCTDVHNEWDIYMLKGESNSTEEFSDLTISIPAIKRTLIVTGLMYETIDSCRYTENLKQLYSSTNENLEAMLYDYDEMKSKIISGNYTSLIILMFGSAGPNEDTREILRTEMLSAINSFVSAGGTLCVQGEGIVSTLLNKLFKKNWYMATYERNTYKRVPALNLSVEMLQSFPMKYNAKTVTLSNVEDDCKVYSDNNGNCTVVIGYYNLGKYAFFGDVNCEDDTVKMIYSLCH